MPDSSIIIPVLWSAATRTSTNDFDRRSSDGVPQTVVDMLNTMAGTIQANHPPAEVWLLHRGVGSTWVLTHFSDAGRSQGGRRMRQYLSVIIRDEDFNRVGRNPGRLMRAGVCAQVLDYARSGTQAPFDAVVPSEAELSAMSATRGQGTSMTDYSSTTSLQQPDGRLLTQQYFMGRNYDSQTARQLLAFVNRNFEVSEGPPRFATWWPADAEGKQWFDVVLTKVKIDVEAGDAQERAKDLYNEVRKTKAKTPGLNWARLDKNADTCLQKLEEFTLKFYKSDPNPTRENELRQLKSEAIVYAKNAGDELELLGEEISLASEQDPLAPQLFRLGDAYSRFGDEDLASLLTAPKVVASSSFNRDPIDGFGDPPKKPDLQNAPKTPPRSPWSFSPIAKIAGGAGLVVLLLFALKFGHFLGNRFSSPAATPVAKETATAEPTVEPIKIPNNGNLTPAQKGLIYDYLYLNAPDEAYKLGKLKSKWRYLRGPNFADQRQKERKYIVEQLFFKKTNSKLKLDQIVALGIIPANEKISFWKSISKEMDRGINEGFATYGHHGGTTGGGTTRGSTTGGGTTRGGTTRGGTTRGGTTRGGTTRGGTTRGGTTGGGTTGGGTTRGGTTRGGTTGGGTTGGGTTGGGTTRGGTTRGGTTRGGTTRGGTTRGGTTRGGTTGGGTTGGGTTGGGTTHGGTTGSSTDIRG